MPRSSSGLTGFLFGVAYTGNVGGTLIGCTKSQRQRRLLTSRSGITTTGSPSSMATSAVRSGTSGKFGYRLNVVGQDGTYLTAPAWQRRYLATGVLDWYVRPGTTLEYIYSHQDDTGVSAGFWTPQGQNFTYGIPLNPGKFWSQPYAGYRRITDREEASLTSKLSSSLTFRAAYSFETSRVPTTYIVTENYWDSQSEYDQSRFSKRQPSTRQIQHSGTWIGTSKSAESRTERPLVVRETTNNIILARAAFRRIRSTHSTASRPGQSIHRCQLLRHRLPWHLTTKRCLIVSISI